MNVPAGAEIALVVVGADKAAQARAAHWEDTLKRLARLTGVAFADAAPKSSAQLLVRGVLVALAAGRRHRPRGGSQRLDKEIEKLEGEAKKLDAKLANPGFLAKAEEEVIDEHRERLEATRARIEKLRAARGRLG